MRFAHTGDCHLGGWRQPELAELNLRSFTSFVDTCLKEKLDFVLIAGDFFDSAYPPIEAIKVAFDQLRRLKEAAIPVFIIAGSHDYSASGKSFIEVLEKAGFVKNACQPEVKGESIYLTPVIYKGVAIYGYPGKRSALEVEDIKKIKLHEAPGLFTILMLHTALRDAVGNLPIPAVDHEKLPKTDYLALAHLHVNYEKKGRVYCGPLFPNNPGELEELRGGSFYIADTKGKIERREIKMKDVVVLDFEVKDASHFSDVVRNTLSKADLKDKILIARLSGYFESGVPSDLRLNDIDILARKQGAYSVLKNIANLKGGESSLVLDAPGDDFEETLIAKFKDEHTSSYNDLVSPLLHVLGVEKKEEEKTALFEERVFDEFKKAVLL